jgi:hypothetical protein
MRNFVIDINNLKIFCKKNKFNFGYDPDTNYKYTILYNLVNGIILEIILIKKCHIYTDINIDPRNIISSFNVHENDERLNINELILHKCDTHNIKI